MHTCGSVPDWRHSMHHKTQRHIKSKTAFVIPKRWAVFDLAASYNSTYRTAFTKSRKETKNSVVLLTLTFDRSLPFWLLISLIYRRRPRTNDHQIHVLVAINVLSIFTGVAEAASMRAHICHRFASWGCRSREKDRLHTLPTPLAISSTTKYRTAKWRCIFRNCPGLVKASLTSLYSDRGSHGLARRGRHQALP